MAISQAQSSEMDLLPLAPRLPWDERARPRPSLSRRARSIGASRNSGTVAICDRMEHTFEYSTYGFKSNLRGEHIHESFTTLQEVLQKLPQTVPFDIELSTGDPGL